MTGHSHDDESLALLVVVFLALGYEWLSLRASKPGRPWPPWRGGSFMAGCAVLALATGIAPDTFTGHMTRHLLVGMVAPLALILGAPITLLLRSLPARYARMVARALHTSAVRWISHPATAMCLTVGTLALLYCTPLYARLCIDPALHHVLDLHFLFSGSLFAWAIAGPDPAPRRPSVKVRLAILGVAVAAHAALSQLLYAGAYVQIPVGTLDRQAGATIMYYGGDLTELLLAGALVATWRPVARRRGGAPA